MRNMHVQICLYVHVYSIDCKIFVGHLLYGHIQTLLEYF